MFAYKRNVLYNTSVYVVNVKQYVLRKESTRCHANITFRSGGGRNFFKEIVVNLTQINKQPSLEFFNFFTY